MGKSSDTRNDDTSSRRNGSRRKDEEDRKSTSSRYRSDSLPSTSTVRKSSRGDDRDGSFNPASSAFSTTSRSAYPGKAAPSVASSYTTAVTGDHDRDEDGSSRPPVLMRNESLTEKMPKIRDREKERGSSYSESGREKRSGRRRDRSRSLDKDDRKRDGRERDKSRSLDRDDRKKDKRERDRKGKRRTKSGDSYLDGSQISDTTFSYPMNGSNIRPSTSSAPSNQFVGQTDNNRPNYYSPVNASSHVPDQFPGQFPSQSSEPFRPPTGHGLAAEYYGDQGESVFDQPGVRPTQPSVIVSADTHLQAASATANPPPEPSSLGQTGAAASFFTEPENFSPSNSPAPPKPSKPPAFSSNPSKPSKPGKPGKIYSGSGALAGGAGLGLATGASGSSGQSHSQNQSQDQSYTSESDSYYQPAYSNADRPSNGQSSNSNMMPTIGAAAAGTAAGYLMGHGSSQHEQYIHPSQSISGDEDQHYDTGSQRPPSYPHSSYDYTRIEDRPHKPKKRPSGSSNAALYAAGAAGMTAAALHNKHSHHSSAQNSFSGGPYQPYPMAHRHRHRGPLSKFVDFFKDPDGVAQFEEYTEYIGVCKYCFEPESSPRDAPRKHHYHPHGSHERLGSTTRVDKLNRIYTHSSSDEEKRGKKSSWLGAGLGGYGLAKFGKSLFSSKDFDDTYSVRTGRYNGSTSKISLHSNDSRHSISKKSYSSHGVTRRSSYRSRSRSRDRIETGLTSDGKYYKKDSRGNLTMYDLKRRGSRSRSRSASRRRHHSGLANAAIGATVGGSVASSISKSRRRSKSPKKRRHRRDSGSSDSRRHHRLGRAHSPSMSHVGTSHAPGKSRAPEVRRKSRGNKSRGLFNWNNSSSSSYDDLAFGSAYANRSNLSPVKADKGKHRDSHAAEMALLGLGAGVAGMAAHDVYRNRKGKKSEIVAVKESRDRRHRKRRDSSPSSSSSLVEDDDAAWEDESEDGSSSIMSGLAYGGYNSKSRESLGSDASGGTDKWVWRWKNKKRRSDSNLPPGRNASDLGSFTALTSEDGRNDRAESRTSLQSMQYVLPTPMSESSQFDVGRQGSIVSPGSMVKPLIEARPGLIPLQAPQPKAPISQSVYATQAPPTQSYSAPAGPPVFSRSGMQSSTRPVPDVDSSRPDLKDAVAEAAIGAGIGAAAANVISSREPRKESARRRRDSSSAHSSIKREVSPKPLKRRASAREGSSSVTFDLTREEEDRQRREKYRLERDQGDRREENRKDQELEGNERPEKRRREREETRRREDAERREAEQQSKLEYEKTQSIPQRKRPEHSRYVADTEIDNDINRFHREKEDEQAPRLPLGDKSRREEIDRQLELLYEEEKRNEEERRREEKKRSAGVWGKAAAAAGFGAVAGAVTAAEASQHSKEFESEEQDRLDRQSRIAQKAVERLRRTPSPVPHDDYATYFTPPDILEHAHNHDAAEAASQDRAAEIIEIVPSDLRVKQPNWDPSYYEAMKGGDDLPKNLASLPWKVPDLNLIEPTPPVSRTPSSIGRHSPVVAAKSEPEHEEPRRVTWGDHKTHEYDVVSMSDHEGFVEDQNKEDTSSPRPTISSPLLEQGNVEPSDSPRGEPEIVEISPPEPSHRDVSPPRTTRHAESPPSKEETEVPPPRMPGGFADDIDFAATLAAGVKDAGFDPSIVIDDPTYRRRESPPGSEASGFYQSPFATIVSEVSPDLDSPGTEGAPPRRGFVEGELPDSPNEEKFETLSKPPELSQGSPTSNGKSEMSRDPITAGFTHTEDVGLLHDDKSRAFSEEPESIPSVNEDKTGDYIEQPSTGETPMVVTNSKSEKYKDDHFDSGDALENELQSPRDSKSDISDRKHKKRRSKRDSGAHDLSIDDTKSLPSDFEGRKKSGRSKRISDTFDDSRSLPDDFDDPKKSKRKSSKRDSGSFDDGGSVISSPARIDESKSKKDRKEKQGGLFSGIFGSKDEPVSEKRRSKELPAEDISEEYSEPRKKSKRKSKDRDSISGIYDVSGVGTQSVNDLSQAAKSTDDQEELYKSRRKREERRRRAYEDVVESSRSGREKPPRESRDGGGSLKSSDSEDQSFLEERPEMPHTPDGASGSYIPPHTSEDAVSFVSPTVETLRQGPESLSSDEGRRSRSPLHSDQTRRILSRSVSPRPFKRSGQRRPSDLRSLETAHGFLAGSSPTAVPLHFKKPPQSPGVVRNVVSSPAGPSPSSPAPITPKRQVRPNSTEFKSSKEFRPLWLVERHSSAKLETEPDEPYPSLPSSRTSSRAPSEYEDAKSEPDVYSWETPSRPESSRRLPPLRLSGDFSHNDHDILDSQTTTPTATSFPSLKEKPKYEFHSPSELLEDPLSVMQGTLISSPNIEAVTTPEEKTIPIIKRESPPDFDLPNLEPVTFSEDKPDKVHEKYEASVPYPLDALPALPESRPTSPTLPSTDRDKVTTWTTAGLGSAAAIIAAAAHRSRKAEVEMESIEGSGSLPVLESPDLMNDKVASESHEAVSGDQPTEIGPQAEEHAPNQHRTQTATELPPHGSPAENHITTPSQSTLTSEPAQDAEAKEEFAPISTKKPKKDKKSKRRNRQLSLADEYDASAESTSLATESFEPTREPSPVRVERNDIDNGPSSIAEHDGYEKDLEATVPLQPESKVAEDEWTTQTTKEKSKKGKKTKKRGRSTPFSDEPEFAASSGGAGDIARTTSIIAETAAHPGPFDEIPTDTHHQEAPAVIEPTSKAPEPTTEAQPEDEWAVSTPKPKKGKKGKTGKKQGKQGIPEEVKRGPEVLQEHSTTEPTKFVETSEPRAEEPEPEPRPVPIEERQMLEVEGVDKDSKSRALAATSDAFENDQRDVSFIEQSLKPESRSDHSHHDGEMVPPLASSDTTVAPPILRDVSQDALASSTIDTKGEFVVEPTMAVEEKIVRFPIEDVSPDTIPLPLDGDEDLKEEEPPSRGASVTDPSILAEAFRHAKEARGELDHDLTAEDTRHPESSDAVLSSTPFYNVTENFDSSLQKVSDEHRSQHLNVSKWPYGPHETEPADVTQPAIDDHPDVVVDRPMTPVVSSQQPVTENPASGEEEVRRDFIDEIALSESGALEDERRALRARKDSEERGKQQTATASEQRLSKLESPPVMPAVSPEPMASMAEPEPIFESPGPSANKPEDVRGPEQIQGPPEELSWIPKPEKKSKKDKKNRQRSLEDESGSTSKDDQPHLGPKDSALELSEIPRKDRSVSETSVGKGPSVSPEPSQDVIMDESQETWDTSSKKEKKGKKSRKSKKWDEEQQPDESFTSPEITEPPPMSVYDDAIKLTDDSTSKEATIEETSFQSSDVSKPKPPEPEHERTAMSRKKAKKKKRSVTWSEDTGTPQSEGTIAPSKDAEESTDLTLQPSGSFLTTASVEEPEGLAVGIASTTALEPTSESITGQADDQLTVPSKKGRKSKKKRKPSTATDTGSAEFEEPSHEIVDSEDVNASLSERDVQYPKVEDSETLPATAIAAEETVLPTTPTTEVELATTKANEAQEDRSSTIPNETISQSADELPASHDLTGPREQVVEIKHAADDQEELAESQIASPQDDGSGPVVIHSEEHTDLGELDSENLAESKSIAAHDVPEASPTDTITVEYGPNEAQVGSKERLETVTEDIPRSAHKEAQPTPINGEVESTEPFFPTGDENHKTSQESFEPPLSEISRESQLQILNERPQIQEHIDQQVASEDQQVASEDQQVASEDQQVASEDQQHIPTEAAPYTPPEVNEESDVTLSTNGQRDKREEVSQGDDMAPPDIEQTIQEPESIQPATQGAVAEPLLTGEPTTEVTSTEVELSKPEELLESQEIPGDLSEAALRPSSSFDEPKQSVEGIGSEGVESSVQLAGEAVEPEDEWALPSRKKDKKGKRSKRRSTVADTEATQTTEAVPATPEVSQSEIVVSRSDRTPKSGPIATEAEPSAKAENKLPTDTLAEEQDDTWASLSKKKTKKGKKSKARHKSTSGTATPESFAAMDSNEATRGIEADLIFPVLGRKSSDEEESTGKKGLSNEANETVTELQDQGPHDQGQGHVVEAGENEREAPVPSQFKQEQEAQPVLDGEPDVEPIMSEVLPQHEQVREGPSTPAEMAARETQLEHGDTSVDDYHMPGSQFTLHQDTTPSQNIPAFHETQKTGYTAPVDSFEGSMYHAVNRSQDQVKQFSQETPFEDETQRADYFDAANIELPPDSPQDFSPALITPEQVVDPPVPKTVESYTSSISADQAVSENAADDEHAQPVTESPIESTATTDPSLIHVRDPFREVAIEPVAHSDLSAQLPAQPEIPRDNRTPDEPEEISVTPEDKHYEDETHVQPESILRENDIEPPIPAEHEQSAENRPDIEPKPQPITMPAADVPSIEESNQVAQQKDRDEFVAPIKRKKSKKDKKRARERTLSQGKGVTQVSGTSTPVAAGEEDTATDLALSQQEIDSRMSPSAMDPSIDEVGPSREVSTGKPIAEIATTIPEEHNKEHALEPSTPIREVENSEQATEREPPGEAEDTWAFPVVTKKNKKERERAKRRQAEEDSGESTPAVVEQSGTDQQGGIAVIGQPEVSTADATVSPDVEMVDPEVKEHADEWAPLVSRKNSKEVKPLEENEASSEKESGSTSRVETEGLQSVEPSEESYKDATLGLSEQLRDEIVEKREEAEEGTPAWPILSRKSSEKKKKGKKKKMDKQKDPEAETLISTPPEIASFEEPVAPATSAPRAGPSEPQELSQEIGGPVADMTTTSQEVEADEIWSPTPEKRGKKRKGDRQGKSSWAFPKEINVPEVAEVVDQDQLASDQSAKLTTVELDVKPESEQPAEVVEEQLESAQVEQAAEAVEPDTEWAYQPKKKKKGKGKRQNVPFEEFGGETEVGRPSVESPKDQGTDSPQEPVQHDDFDNQQSRDELEMPTSEGEVRVASKITPKELTGVSRKKSKKGTGKKSSQGLDLGALAEQNLEEANESSEPTTRPVSRAETSEMLRDVTNAPKSNVIDTSSQGDRVLEEPPTAVLAPEGEQKTIDQHEAMEAGDTVSRIEFDYPEQVEQQPREKSRERTRERAQSLDHHHMSAIATGTAATTGVGALASPAIHGEHDQEERAPSPNSKNRDSGVHVMDTTTIQEHGPAQQSVRDSGYVPSPITHSDRDSSLEPIRETTSTLAASSRRHRPISPTSSQEDMSNARGMPQELRDSQASQMETNTTDHGYTVPLDISVEIEPPYQVSISRPTSTSRCRRGSIAISWKGDNAADNEAAAAEDSQRSPDLPDMQVTPTKDGHRPRQPSPVDSTTKDRSSALFNSSPSTRLDSTPQQSRIRTTDLHGSPEAHSRNEHSPQGGLHRSPSVHSRRDQSPHTGLHRSPSVRHKRGRNSHDLGGLHEAETGSYDEFEASDPRSGSLHSSRDLGSPERVPSLFGGPTRASVESMMAMSPPRTPLDTIAEHTYPEPQAQGRHRDPSDVGSPNRRPKAARRTATPTAMTSEQLRYPGAHPAVPPVALTPGGIADEALDRLSWPAVDDEEDTVDIDRVKSRGSSRSHDSGQHASQARSSALPPHQRPHPLDLDDIERTSRVVETPERDIRSPGSIGSARSSGTPPLRRVGRSTSSDLRAASKRDQTRSRLRAKRQRGEAAEVSRDQLGRELDLLNQQQLDNNTPSSSTYDPVLDKGKGKVRAMADVFEGYGDSPGSPLSPSRPPSVRRRQSLQQIRDLEARLDQLASENRLLASAKIAAEKNLEDFHFSQSRDIDAQSKALEARDLQLREKDGEIGQLRETLDWLQKEVTRLTELNEGLTATNVSLVAEHEQRYKVLQQDHASTHEQWQQATRELEDLREQHHELSTGMEGLVRHELDTALAQKNEELAQLTEELEMAKDKIRTLQAQILSSKSGDILVVRDEDYFDGACQALCQHVQQWVLRFSKFSDMRACRLPREIQNEKIADRFDNAILDGSDVEDYLSDRIKRRDVFMSVVMNMVWEYVFTRYLFGMDREQRQKLKQLEKQLAEVGPQSAVQKWRATTLTLLSRRPSFQSQRDLDTEAVVQEIYHTLSKFLPPPSSLENQILDSLRNVMRSAVSLSIEMRTQRAEYMMLPPLQPEYDIHGDLARKVYFNASLMNERSGETTSNEELEQQQAAVRMVLFPLVVKKGTDNGEGDEEIVVCPAQVLVVKPGKDKKVVRVLSGDRMSIDQASYNAPSSMGLDPENVI